MTDNDKQPAPPHARVQDILLLPPLPAIALKLLQLVSREDCDIQELSHLIEQDPGIAARIVGIANSAYFARPTPVCSVADAIVRVLGLNLVRGIAIGIALSKPFDPGACPDFQLDRYWYRAMCSATLAAQLAPLARLPETAHACLFLSGLLHNLGQLVLAHAFPDRMSQVFRAWAQQPGQSLLALESQHLHMTEVEAGTLVARRWQLPAGVSDVIEFRRDPSRAGASAPLVELIAYCAAFASALYDDPQAEAQPQPQAGAAVAEASADAFARALQRVRAQDAQLRALAQSMSGTV
ncbi:MAG TPA: HDOD domain-containing protein [Gammaproteobacteria bacterium]